MARLNSYRELEHLRERLKEERKGIKTTVMVCGGTGCQASESQGVIDALKEEMAKQGLGTGVRLCVTGCHGFCEQGPVMIIEPSDIFYCRLTTGDAHEVVAKTLARGEIIDRLLYTGPSLGQEGPNPRWDSILQCPRQADTVSEP